MNVLVIGGGGREHALAWKAAASPRVARVFVAPGNAGTAREPGLVNLPVTGIDELVAAAKRESIGLAIVGPEAPLAAGVVDAFRAAGIPVVGPTRAAAQLESSKDFAKAFMLRHGIPTAAYRTFTDPAAARAYVRERGAPIVVKADGLAAGKGVVVATSVGEAEAAIDAMLTGNTLGAAGARVVIEELPRRRGGELHRAVRRRARAAARVVAGPQAPGRRRHGPQHRRHGRVLARAGRHAGRARAHHARGDPADDAGHGRRRHRRTRACSTRA